MRRQKATTENALFFGDSATARRRMDIAGNVSNDRRQFGPRAGRAAAKTLNCCCDTAMRFRRDQEHEGPARANDCMGAFSARETYRLSVNDLGNADAAPMAKQDYDQMRSASLGGAAPAWLSFMVSGAQLPAASLLKELRKKR